MTKLKTYLAFAAASLLVPAVASAEPMRDADRVHDFHSVDRFTPQSTFAFNLGYELWDKARPELPDLTVLGFDISGHFVSEAGAGGYVVLPLGYVGIGDTEVGGVVILEGDSEVLVGNLEVGGLYAKPIDRNLDLLFRVGLVAPTGPDSDDSAPAAAFPFSAVPRYGDLPQHWHKSMWLRMSASPMGHFGPIFWRVDAGIDLMLDDNDETTADISPVFRVNMAGGIDLGQLDVTAELATNISDPEDDNADETASTFALGARFSGGSVQPGFALMFPVGFEESDTYDLEMALAFSLVGHMK